MKTNFTKKARQTHLFVPIELIVRKIYLIRDKKVMLDKDLAALYGVPTRVFNQAVKRNLKRFPEDFMFQLNKEEFKILRSQIVISRWGGSRYLPLAFTEQGVAMLSSVLNSDRAIQVNIAIMRTFSRLRDMLMHYAELKKELKDMDRKYQKRFKITDKRFRIVFEVLKRLTIEEQKPKKRIGFCAPKARI